MDLFRDDHYKGHVVFTHAAGPGSGPWVGSFSVWLVDNAGEYSCVSQGSASDSYPSKQFANCVAFDLAKQRIDSLLAASTAAAAAGLAVTLRLPMGVSQGTFLIDRVFFPAELFKTQV